MWLLPVAIVSCSGYYGLSVQFALQSDLCTGCDRWPIKLVNDCVTEGGLLSDIKKQSGSQKSCSNEATAGQRQRRTPCQGNNNAVIT